MRLFRLLFVVIFALSFTSCRLFGGGDDDEGSSGGGDQVSIPSITVSCLTTASSLSTTCKNYSSFGDPPDNRNTWVWWIRADSCASIDTVDFTNNDVAARGVMNTLCNTSYSPNQCSNLNALNEEGKTWYWREGATSNSQITTIEAGTYRVYTYMDSDYDTLPDSGEPYDCIAVELEEGTTVPTIGGFQDY